MADNQVLSSRLSFCEYTVHEHHKYHRLVCDLHFLKGKFVGKVLGYSMNLQHPVPQPFAETLYMQLSVLDPQMLHQIRSPVALGILAAARYLLLAGVAHCKVGVLSNSEIVPRW